MPYVFVVTGLDPASSEVVEVELVAETVIEAMRTAKARGLKYVSVRRVEQEQIDSVPPIEQADGRPVQLAPPGTSPTAPQGGEPPPEPRPKGEPLNGAGGTKSGVSA